MQIGKKMNSTQQKLLLVYGKTHITLEKAVEDWLPHLSESTARRRARTQSLPWPVINTDPSQKAVCFVSIAAIAEWLDKQEQAAKTEWASVQN